MPYRILVLGKPLALPFNNNEIDYLETGNYRDYDLVLDGNTGELFIGFTEKSLGFVSLKGEDPITEGLIRLEKEEFNPRLALEMLGGNEKIYKNSLKLYQEEYLNLKEKLLRYQMAGNYQGIKELIHRVKGFVLYTGGIHLHQLAVLLDNELYENETTYLNAFLRAHQRLLEYCCEQVKDV
jgi:HPt (histidine-containing phosphotransfer) domain-containing protein